MALLVNLTQFQQLSYRVFFLAYLVEGPLPRHPENVVLSGFISIIIVIIEMVTIHYLLKAVFPIDTIELDCRSFVINYSSVSYRGPQVYHS